MNKPLIIAFAALAGAVDLAAQDHGTDARDRVVQEVNEKTRLMREGHVIRTNVRVTVRLLNGSRLRGVVRNGRFIERVDGLTFVPSEMTEPNAGLRLWYYDETNSYIFLPYASIETHQIGEQLSQLEVIEIGRQFDEQARKRAELAASERDRATAEKQQDKTGTADAGKGATPPAGTSSPLTAEQKALLDEFPISGGWGKDRMEEIESRKIRLGVYPDDKSKRFLEVFSQWNEANELARAAESQSTRQSVGPTPVPTPGPTPLPTPVPTPNR